MPDPNDFDFAVSATFVRWLYNDHDPTPSLPRYLHADYTGYVSPLLTSDWPTIQPFAYEDEGYMPPVLRQVAKHKHLLGPAAPMERKPKTVDLTVRDG